MRQSGFLNWALRYAERGWYVFPIAPRAKKPPLTPQGYKNAAIDPAALREWWAQNPAANIGLACGASGLVVIDLDEDQGKQTWAALAEKYGLTTDTPNSATGGGGAHIFYRAPAGAAIKNSTGKLGPGVDVRAAGGYVVLPPSIHPSGNAYRWGKGFDPSKTLQELPPALLGLLSERRPPRAPQPVNGAYARAALDRELAGLRATPNGARNTGLNGSAFSLGQLVGARALDRGEVERALLDGAMAIGLGEAEALATIQSGLEAGLKQPRAIPERAARASNVYVLDKAKPMPAPALPSGGRPLTDLGNAERFAEQHSGRVKFVPAWGWMVFDGKRWKRDAGAARRLAKKTVRGIYGEAANCETEAEAKSIASWAMRSESDIRIRAMLSLAESELGVQGEPDDFDAEPWLLNCRNGTLDLRTGNLRPHDPADLITHMTGIDFDAAAACPLWLSFLARVMDSDQAKIDFLHRAIGYSLTGDIGEQCLLLLYGVGANGKSTFLELLRLLLGTYGQTAEFSTFLANRGDAIRNDVARMAGTRLITAIESDEGRRLAEVLVKQLTGGDTVAARFLHREHFEFRPQFKIWLAANHKPVIRGTDYAIWRRIRLIPFTVTIPEGERDPKLPERLRAELPGILAWAVRGCLDWQSTGLQTPEAVKAATNTYRAEMDTLAAFLDECCIAGLGLEATAAQLYAGYQAWAEAQGERVESQRALALRLIERGFVQARGTGGVRKWRGLGLLASGDV